MNNLERFLLALGAYWVAKEIQNQRWCQDGCQQLFGAVATEAQKQAISLTIGILAYQCAPPKKRRYRRLS